MTTRTKTVGVRVTPEVWARVRMRCLERGESCSALVERLLVEWLGAKSGPPGTDPVRVREALDRVGREARAQMAAAKAAASVPPAYAVADRGLRYERED